MGELREQMKGDLHKDEELEEQARNNDIDQFRHVFHPRALEAFVMRAERNAKVSSDLMENEKARKYFFEAIMHRFFEDAQKADNRPAI